MATLKNSECPKGYTKRKSYTRKFRSSVKASGFTVRRKGKVFTYHPTKDEVHVPASCVRNPVKQTKATVQFGKLRKGDLIKYGYQYRLSDAKREKALQKAIDVYGALRVYHKLDAVAKLSVRTASDASKIFARDRNWVRDNFVGKPD